LPLQRTSVPGVYRRGSKYVVVYRVEGRQRKQTVGTLTEARAVKRTRDAQARAQRSGPTLHAFSLQWLDAYAGTGHDALRENTRREYRRLLTAFALEYFDAGVRSGSRGPRGSASPSMASSERSMSIWRSSRIDSSRRSRSSTPPARGSS